MILEVEPKFCKRNLVEYMPLTDRNQLIVGQEGIILLRIDGKVLINRFMDYAHRLEFPYGNKEQSDIDHYTELFAYNSLYLNFSSCFNHLTLERYFFFKRKEGALALDDILALKQSEAVEIRDVFDRRGIESYFDYSKRDCDFAFVFNRMGDILYIGSEKDGIDMGYVIPTNDQIVELDFRNRYWKSVLLGKTHSNKRKLPQSRRINSITNLPLYGPLSDDDFSHYLLTGKDGHFELEAFRLKFLKEDTFELTVAPIDIKEPTIDDVLNYCQNFSIGKAFQPKEEQISNEGRGSIKFTPTKTDK